MNLLLLYLATRAYSFSSPYWLTFKQCNELGGTIKKGSKSQIVVFFKFREVRKKAREFNEDTGQYEEVEKDAKVPFLRYYRVFNIEQAEGIEIPKEEEIEFEPLEECERIVADFADKPNIMHGHDYASYVPSQDLIEMPIKNFFKST